MILRDMSIARKWCEPVEICDLTGGGQMKQPVPTDERRKPGDRRVDNTEIRREDTNPVNSFSRQIVMPESRGGSVERRKQNAALVRRLKRKRLPDRSFGKWSCKKYFCSK